MADRLEARVKKNERFARYIFFSGHEYVKEGWRPVPAGFEDQARNESKIETRPLSRETVKPKPTAKEVEEAKTELYARVKKNAKREHYFLFSGHEYVKKEWRPVPAGFEDQARAHEDLDVKLSKDLKNKDKKSDIQEPGLEDQETPDEIETEA